MAKNGLARERDIAFRSRAPFHESVFRRKFSAVDLKYFLRGLKFPMKLRELPVAAKVAKADGLHSYKDNLNCNLCLITRDLKVMQISFICIMDAYLHFIAFWILICIICIMGVILSFWGKISCKTP